MPSIGPERPQVLIYDAASCHLGLEVIELALQEDIHILVLPAKSTAFLQPLDQIMHVLQVLCMGVGRHFDYSFSTLKERCFSDEIIFYYFFCISKVISLYKAVLCHTSVSSQGRHTKCLSRKLDSWCDLTILHRL